MAETQDGSGGDSRTDSSGSGTARGTDSGGRGNDAGAQRRTRWFTKRSVVTLVAVTVASVALFKGKMGDSVWVYAMAVFIAGHHAEDLIKAWKGGS